MRNRIRVAKLLFSLDAVLGILVIGAACLFGAAYNRHTELSTIALTTFAPLAVLWSSFCLCAFKGLTSENVILKIVFWSYLVCNALVFPVGTAIAGGSIWLWRDLKRDLRPVPV